MDPERNKVYDKCSASLELICFVYLSIDMTTAINILA